MNHLTTEGISGVVAGTCSPEEEQHSRECRICSAEIVQTREMLSMFRSSLRAWVETEQPAELLHAAPAALPLKRMRDRPLTWALVTAAMLVMVGLPVYRNSKDRERKAQAEEDVLLIRSVNAQLSRRAPVAMESLEPLMLKPRLKTAFPAGPADSKIEKEERGVQ